MARKRKSKPTTTERSKKQTVRDRYSHAREDAQLLGLIPTTPEEALRSERVDPLVQSEQNLPQLTGMAIRRGWATPEEKKPRLVDELVSIVEDPEAKNLDKIMAYNALAKGDQMQYERDKPEEAAKARGPGVTVEVNQTVQQLRFADVLRMMSEEEQATIEGKDLSSSSNGESKPKLRYGLTEDTGDKAADNAEGSPGL